jgi:hypothetical protein
MPSKDLQHCHALVALAFADDEARRNLVSTLAGRASIDARAIENFTHDGRPAAVIHMRYRARGANMNDMPGRLQTAAKAAGVEYEVIQEPKGFSVKRPELEQDFPRRNTTEPTGPVQADWSQASSITGPDAPFQGALRVPLIGPVDEEWLAALDDVRTGTDVLEAEVEDAALYVPDPWKDEPALTQAGEARHTLREAATKFVNLVNDQHAHRTTPDHVREARRTFDALVKGAVQHVESRAPALAGEPNPLLHLIYECRTGVGIQSGDGLSHELAVGVWRAEASGRIRLTPPDSIEERDAAIDRLVQRAAEVVAGRGKPRVALVFTSWVDDEPWAVVHVCDRERSVTRQTPLVVQVSDDNVATLKTRWETVNDRGRFRALQETIGSG